MDFLELSWVQWVLGVIGGAFALWVIPNKLWAKLVSLFGTKIAPMGESIAKALDGAGALAQGAGLEKVATIAYELSDVVDEAADVPQLIVDLAADGDLSKEDVKAILEAGHEAVVEGKDFYVKVIKKTSE